MYLFEMATSINHELPYNQLTYMYMYVLFLYSFFFFFISNFLRNLESLWAEQR